MTNEKPPASLNRREQLDKDKEHAMLEDVTERYGKLRSILSFFASDGGNGCVSLVTKTASNRGIEEIFGLRCLNGLMYHFSAQGWIQAR